MKTGVRTITYAVAEPKTYLVAALDSGVEPVEFCVRMAERNQIPGLLAMHRQIDDGDVTLYFDITGKRRLQDVLRESSEKQLLMLMTALVRAIQGLPDYFLRAGQCLLEPEYTFADSQGSVYLPLVPLAEDQADSNPQLKSYLTALLGAYAPENGAPSPKVAALIGAVIKPDFTLDAFAKLLTPAQEASRPVQRPVETPPVRHPASPVLDTPPAAQPRPVVSEPEKPVQKPTPPAQNGGFSIPGVQIPGVQIPGAGGGVNIPGAAPEPPKKDKKKKDKPEKEKKSFGFLGRKKDSRVDMDKESHVISAAVPPAPSVVPPPAPAPAAGRMSSAPVQPAYYPQQSQGGGQWSGTVQLAGQGATEFMQDGAGAQGSALLHSGRRIVLSAQTFTIGRVNCSYVVDNPKVSRLHATILREGERYLIRDENSSNHTYLNGVMIPPYTPVELQNGSEIRLGSEEFRFVQGNG